MDLDPHSVIRTDFALVRRGYDPDEVRAHLARIADAVEELRRRASSSPVAEAMSEKVRSIVEAAEESAEQIERDAQLSARRIEQESRQEAERIEQRAREEAGEQVRRAETAVSELLVQAGKLDQSLGGLVSELEEGLRRAVQDLAALHSRVDAIGASAGRSAGAKPQAPAPPPVSAAEPEPRGEPESEPEPEPGPKPLREAGVAAEPAMGGEEDRAADERVEGARLIALNMALNGSPREETDRYLAENFDLTDREAVLDDVYSRVEG